MTTPILGAPPEDVRTEWSRLNSLCRNVAQLEHATSSHPHLVAVSFNEAGFVFDFSGLINALAAKGTQL